MLLVVVKTYCNHSWFGWGQQRITRYSKALLVAFLVLILAGCGPSAGPPSELAFGQEPYLRYCASCHGNQGQGKPPTFPPLSQSRWLETGPEAMGLIVLYGLRGEIEVQGRTYRGYMPPMQHISDEDIAGLLTYMRQTWGDSVDAVTVEEISHLRGIFDGPRPPLAGYEGLQEALDNIQ